MHGRMSLKKIKQTIFGISEKEQFLEEIKNFYVYKVNIHHEYYLKCSVMHLVPDLVSIPYTDVFC